MEEYDDDDDDDNDMHQSCPYQIRSAVKYNYRQVEKDIAVYVSKRASSARNCGCISFAFYVSISRANSLTSNGRMSSEVYCRCCVGRRPIQFEAELYYLDFSD